MYVFYRAQLKNKEFGPSSESTEVALFNEEDIPWDELAFPVVRAVLKRYLSDRKSNQFDVIQEVITRQSHRP